MFKGACFLANTINPIPPNNERLDLGKLSNNVFLKVFVKIVFQNTSKAIPFQIWGKKLANAIFGQKSSIIPPTQTN